MDNNSQDLLNAGSDILKSVTKAIDTNDYSKLALEISNTIKSVSIERKTTYASGVNHTQNQYRYRAFNGQNINMANVNQNQMMSYPFFAKRISRYNGILELILGSGIGFVMFWIFLASLFSESLVFVLIMAAILFVCGASAYKGFKKLKLAKEFYKYGHILKKAEYFAVSDLAKAALESDATVLSNLKEMIKESYLPRAKFDATENTCMITDAAYQMYMGAVQDQMAREQRQAQEQALLGKDKPVAGQSNKVQSIINEGQEYIIFVRQINDIIPDTEEMSNKLYKLESIMNKIFEQVKKEPETAEDLHKLMNYYLPTTRKLLTAYVELDKQAGTGENVQQTKKEIDAVMDTINDAFEKLLDSLFQNMAWDISSDISVMKTMMAQDGLTSDGLAVAAAGGMAMQAAQAAPQEQVQQSEQEQGITLQFGNK